MWFTRNATMKQPSSFFCPQCYQQKNLAVRLDEIHYQESIPFSFDYNGGTFTSAHDDSNQVFFACSKCSYKHSSDKPNHKYGGPLVDKPNAPEPDEIPVLYIGGDFSICPLCKQQMSNSRYDLNEYFCANCYSRSKGKIKVTVNKKTGLGKYLNQETLTVHDIMSRNDGEE